MPYLVQLPKSSLRIEKWVYELEYRKHHFPGIAVHSLPDCLYFETQSFRLKTQCRPFPKNIKNLRNRVGLDKVYYTDL